MSFVYVYCYVCLYDYSLEWNKVVFQPLSGYLTLQNIFSSQFKLLVDLPSSTRTKIGREMIVM